jgi:hypothetical protein
MPKLATVKIGKKKSIPLKTVPHDFIRSGRMRVAPEFAGRMSKMATARHADLHKLAKRRSARGIKHSS